MDGPEKPPRDAIQTLILILTGIVAFYIVVATLAVVIIKLNNFSADVSGITNSLDTMITAILGALLGLLAGRGMDRQ
jgi:type IV secretory pathway VirB2 component (pilin)